MTTREKYNPEFVEELLEAAKKPPERTFKNVEELLRWLDVDFEGEGLG